MVKRIVKETVTEYDKDGNIIKQTVTETTEDDDTIYWPSVPSSPSSPSPWWGIYGPTCDCSAKTE